MLSSISWEKFLTVVAILVAGYYLVTIIIFYRRELAHLIKNGVSLGASRNDDGEGTGSNTAKAQPATSSMMGAAGRKGDRSMPHTSTETSDNLAYAPSDELPDTISEAGTDDDGVEEIPVGIISDLLEELKAICGAITDSVATKEEASALFEALLSRYRELKDTPYRRSISDHIYSITREPFLVNFSREEIEGFWDSEPEEQ